MVTELLILALAAVLLLAHIMVAIRMKTRQYGVEWNMGARDEALPPLYWAGVPKVRSLVWGVALLALLVLLGVLVFG